MMATPGDQGRYLNDLIHLYDLNLFKFTGIQPIVISQAARDHPLFPVLDLIHLQNQQNTTLIKGLTDKQMKSTAEIKELQRELAELVNKHTRMTFILKQAGYEVSMSFIIMIEAIDIV